MTRLVSFLLAVIGCLVLNAAVTMSQTKEASPTLEPFFTKDGPVKEGWLTRDWTDVSKPPKWAVNWEVRDGVLHGTGHYSTGSSGDKWIGTWLLTEREYSDFIMEVDFKFMKDGKYGNGGVALRAPLKGDPAYEGFELQITDPRFEYPYFPNAGPDELTGSLYLVLAPKRQVYRAGEWNHYRIEARGSMLKAWLNDVLIHDVDLDTLTAPAKRHGEGTALIEAMSGGKRPRRGHLGLQDLSENGEVLLFRNVKIAALD